MQARYILTNLIPNRARPQKPGPTNNSAADNQKLSKRERFSRTEQSYAGRIDIKVNTTDTRLELLIAS